MVSIRRVELPLAGLDALVAEAQREGYQFLDRLVQDWETGTIRFDGTGEGLFGVFSDGELVGIGGLTRDSFAQD